MYHWWSRADFLIALGTRLFPAALNWGTDRSMSIIKVDHDPGELGRLPVNMTAVQADAGEFARRVTRLVRARMRGRRPDRTAVMTDVSAEVAADLQPLEMQRILLGILREELGEDGVLVSDLTQLHYVAPDAYPVYRPRTFIHASYQGTLGHAAASGIGAQVAVPDRPVVALAGDGGFLFTMQEMATAVRFNVPVTWVVMNDGAYGNVKRMLQENYGNRVLGAELSNPDFVTLAESFGVPGRRADTPESFRTALRASIDTDGPSLVEYVAPEFPSPWPLYFRPRIRGA
jgi:acetolactate synthase-1/2/3 large subunit